MGGKICGLGIYDMPEAEVSRKWCPQPMLIVKLSFEIEYNAI